MYFTYDFSSEAQLPAQLWLSDNLQVLKSFTFRLQKLSSIVF